MKPNKKIDSSKFRILPNQQLVKIKGGCNEGKDKPPDKDGPINPDK